MGRRKIKEKENVRKQPTERQRPTKNKSRSSNRGTSLGGRRTQLKREIEEFKKALKI